MAAAPRSTSCHRDGAPAPYLVLTGAAMRCDSALISRGRRLWRHPCSLCRTVSPAGGGLERRGVASDDGPSLAASRGRVLVMSFRSALFALSAIAVVGIPAS